MRRLIISILVVGSAAVVLFAVLRKHDLPDADSASDSKGTVSPIDRVKLEGDLAGRGGSALPQFIDPNSRDSLRTRCEGGATNDCLKLGLDLWTGGTGGPRNSQQAIEAFVKACDKDTEGCQLAGALLMQGKHPKEEGPGIRVDGQRALVYLDKACEAKNVTACSQAASIYELGIGGVSPSDSKAKGYNDKAAALGYLPP